MFWKKSLILMMGVLSVGVAQGIVTNYWASSSGGNWSNTANWTAKNPDGSAATVDVAADRVYDFSALASGETVACDVANVIPREIVFAKTADGDAWTLTATKDLNIKSQTVAVTVPAGCTLNYGLRVPNGYGGSITMTVKGGGHFNLTSPAFSPYCMRLILDHTKMTIASGCTCGPFVARLVGDDARLTLGKSSVLLGLESTEGNPTIDIGSLTLYLRSGYEGWQKFSYGGSIVGTGSLVMGGGVMQLFTRANALSRSLKLLNSDTTFAAGAPYVGSTVEIAANGRFTSSNDQSVAVLKGAGITGGVDIPSGNSFTVAATAANTFAGGIEGAGSFVKDGSATLKLTGTSSHTGGTRVKAGTLELASWSSAVRGVDAHLSDTAIYLDFTDPANLVANRSASGLEFGAQAKFVSTNGIVGNAVFMPGGYYSAVTAETRDWLTEKGKTAYTISTWLCPDININTTKYVQVFLRGHWENGAGAAQLDWLAFYGQGTDRLYLRTATTNAADGVKYDRSLTIPKPDASKTWGEQGWFHVAVTYGNHRRIAYINGVEVARDTADIPDVSELNNTVTFGGEYRGIVDEFVYDVRQWSADEVKAEYERMSSALDEAKDGAADLPKPVAHYAFDDAANPGKDSSGNGYDLVNPGSVYCPYYNSKNEPRTVTSKNVTIRSDIPGTYGKCGSFSTSALRYPETSPFPAKIPTGNAPFSVSVRYQMNRSMGPSLVEWGDNTVANHYVRLANGSSPSTARVEFSGNGNSHASGVAPNASPYLREDNMLPGAQRGERVTWTHVIWTYDPASSKFYCYYDGVNITINNNAKSLPFDIQATNLIVGCCSRSNSWSSDSEKFFNGYIDDIRIYDCVLTADQVTRLTRSMATGTIAPTLPAGGSVTIDVGATVKVSSGADHSFASIGGSGTLDTAALSRVTLTGGGTVAATVKGAGALRASGSDLALTGDLSAFNGDLEATNAALTVSSIASNAVIRVLAGGRVTGETLAAKAVLPEDFIILSDATGSTLPLIQTKGLVKVPTRAAFNFTCPIQDVTRAKTRLFPIATGRLDLPENFDAWTYTNPDGRYALSFEVLGTGEVKTLYAKIKYGGIVVIFR